MSADVDRDNLRLTPASIAPLFLLPKIESIYTRGLSYWGDDYDVDYRNDHPGFSLAARSSTIQNLFFEDAHEGDVQHAIMKMVDAAKSLKSIVFKKCKFDDFDILVGKLGRQHGESLEDLVYIDNEELRGYRCQSFRPEHIHGLSNIRTITLEMDDVRLESLYRCETAECANGMSGNVGSYEEFVQLVSEELVPSGLETLIFSSAHASLNKNDVKAIDDALIKLVQEGPGSLKSIHLELVEKDIQRSGRDPCLDASGTWFRRLVECGNEHGIKVYTGLDQRSTARGVAEIMEPIYGFCSPDYSD